MMTDAEVRRQVDRTDRFIAEFREMVAATAVDTASPCADYHRRGLERIAATVGQVDYAFFSNLANINAALRGGLLEVIEVRLLRSVLARHWTLWTPRRSSPVSGR